MQPKFSIVIPARDEEKWIGGCLDSIQRAVEACSSAAETIVVANRCTDGTEDIARARGAIVVREDSKCLSRIRNAGARAASGEIIVTIDADSRMSPRMLGLIAAALESGRYIGGGAPIRPERWSAGILATMAIIYIFIVPPGLSAGLFWCYRRDFDAIGGFDESKVIAEDIDFALRLRAHGRTKGKRFGTVRGAHIVTSCRKFDRYGDWFSVRMMFTEPMRVRRALRGESREFADSFFYDYIR